MCLTAVAQPPEYQDLVILFADGKYDKCISKSTKYKEKDTRAPLPHLYLSKAYFEISKDQSWIQKDPVYKRAYGNALKFAASFVKKDKEKAFQNERDVIEYFEVLKGSVLETVESHMYDAKPKYSKAISELKRLVTFAPDDAGAWLLKAVCNTKNKVRKAAQEDFEMANKILENLNFKQDVMHMDASEKLSDIEDWKKEVMHNSSARSLMVGIMEAAKLLNTDRRQDDAKKLMNTGFQWFENHEDYKALYNEIVN